MSSNTYISAKHSTSSVNVKDSTFKTAEDLEEQSCFISCRINIFLLTICSSRKHNAT